MNSDDFVYNFLWLWYNFSSDSTMRLAFFKLREKIRWATMYVFCRWTVAQLSRHFIKTTEWPVAGWISHFSRNKLDMSRRSPRKEAGWMDGWILKQSGDPVTFPLSIIKQLTPVIFKYFNSSWWYLRISPCMQHHGVKISLTHWFSY